MIACVPRSYLARRCSCRHADAEADPSRSLLRRARQVQARPLALGTGNQYTTGKATLWLEKRKFERFVPPHQLCCERRNRGQGACSGNVRAQSSPLCRTADEASPSLDPIKESAGEPTNFSLQGQFHSHGDLIRSQEEKGSRRPRNDKAMGHLNLFRATVPRSRAGIWV
jgi:hypothetical protein